MSSAKASVEEAGSQRLDKWLWAARFFKTRPLAVEAINGGKVHLDGQRAKPGRSVRPGTRLSIHKGQLEWQIEVKALSKQRRPASEAALLFEEDEQSRLKRQELVQERRAAGPSLRVEGGRPTKRDRRRLSELTGK
ncbi:RNA-binding protein S4 [Lamprobacter modestohalophilus]|uniref:Heat shock protein 15 n=1 Tax=Lamprobacter modestohalophilus TaxID=1064514 RepID=A0A9X0W6A6_9GAMM|nr:S4 domain-containing protein [Lamprobacter modestohalophilus]MBK1617817.1 RNA-binding protein S4 [Lamprobacter modestohalophilus]MCF7979576.1 RNA-binding S4 domain-containing protein [Chromatiaceae bacterium]